MSHLEKFSKEVDLIAKSHPKSRVVRVFCRIEYWLRRHWENKPMQFYFVDGDHGTPVGEPMDVHHLSLHDMMEHEARGQLTAEVLLKGRRVNAFSREAYVQMEEMVGRTTIQPRWI